MDTIIDYAELNSIFDKISDRFQDVSPYNSNSNIGLKSGCSLIYSKLQLDNSTVTAHLTEEVNPETGSIKAEALYLEIDEGTTLRSSMIRALKGNIKPLPLETNEDCGIYIDAVRDFANRLN